MIERGWRGFDVEWTKKDQRSGKGGDDTRMGGMRIKDR
jgi:hypothetical protein